MLPSLGFKRKVLMNTSFGNFLSNLRGILMEIWKKFRIEVDCILYHFPMYYNTHANDDFTN